MRGDQRRPGEPAAPRALLTPFTDNVELTEADRKMYAGQAEAQQAKGFQRVDVTFHKPEADDDTGVCGPDGQGMAEAHPRSGGHTHERHQPNAVGGPHGPEGST